MSRPCAVTLRLARAEEARPMAEMSRQLIEAGLAWRYTPRRIAALINDPETVALVACDAQRLQGFAVMQFGDVRAHLVLLCVRPPQQRRGIGARLNDWLIASARVAGIESVHLELRVDNASALAFYRTQGFVETGRVSDYYGGQIGAQRMVRRLRQVDAGRPAFDP